MKDMKITTVMTVQIFRTMGIDAMDPDGFGYDGYGNWDQERLGF